MTKENLPFLKWPGGKRWLTPYLLESLESLKFNRYFEPFLGGGATFFSLCPNRAFLSDVNSNLINVYNQVAKNHEKLIMLISAFPTDKKSYYNIRNTEYKTALESAAQFLYLNRTCYGGMYRVNKDGKFNVPYGGRSPDILWKKNLLKNASELLKNAKISCCDFQSAIAKTRNGDLLYCDPTYTVAHNDNGFQRYNEKIFSWNDQIRLKDACFKAVKRGVTVIVSNAAHESIKELYSPLKPNIVKRYTGVSRNKNGRKEVDEFLYIIRK